MKTLLYMNLYNHNFIDLSYKIVTYILVVLTVDKLHDFVSCYTDGNCDLDMYISKTNRKQSRFILQILYTYM